MNTFRSDTIASTTCRFATIVLVALSLAGRIASAEETHRSGIPRLNNDKLGESLKRFRSLHRDANCVRRQDAEFDDKTLKANWLRWVDCSVEKGVTFEGQKLYAEANPSRPFGMLAIFYKRKLVELSYMLSSTSIDSLSLILARRYGKASRVTYDRAGHAVFVEWADRVASLDLEFVPIFPAIAKGSFLSIGEGQESKAVRIRTRFNAMPSNDP